MKKVKENTNDTILFIGDSITDVKFNRRNKQLKAHPSYPLQVKSDLTKLNYNFVFKGIASNRSYHVYDRLTSDCIKYNPKCVIILIGINDIWQELHFSDYPKNELARKFEPHFREILRRFNTELKDTKFLFLLPFVIENNLPRNDGMYQPLIEHIELEKKLINEYGYTDIINLNDVFINASKVYDPLLLSTDGVHPTKLGHSYIANEVVKYIKNGFSIK